MSTPKPSDNTREFLHQALMNLKSGDFPEGCAQAAVLYEKLECWEEAAKMWFRARAASIGHNRRARYEECQIRCEAKIKT